LISIEPVFCEPIKLDQDIFNALYDAQCEMANQDEVLVEGIHYNRPE
jgi:hypothetical protein